MIIILLLLLCLIASSFLFFFSKTLWLSENKKFIFLLTVCLAFTVFMLNEDYLFWMLFNKLNIENGVQIIFFLLMTILIPLFISTYNNKLKVTSQEISFKDYKTMVVISFFYSLSLASFFLFISHSIISALGQY